MKWIYGLLVILGFSRFGCSPTELEEVKPIQCGFSEIAVVKDLSELDGCGFALELPDGSKLIPQRLVYIQAPDSAQDPAYYFQFKADQKVCFSYRETDGVDACMAGKLVFLTHIQVCEEGSLDE